MENFKSTTKNNKFPKYTKVVYFDIHFYNILLWKKVMDT